MPIPRRPVSATTSRRMRRSCCRRCARRRAPPTFVGSRCRPIRISCASRRGRTCYPLSPFAPALAVAARAAIALPVRGRARGGIAWPSIPCSETARGSNARSDRQRLRRRPVRRLRSRRPGGTRGACCDSTDITCAQARDRAVLLHYLETLVEWGDALRRRGNAPEAFQQARVIFDAARVILGPTSRARCACARRPRRRPSAASRPTSRRSIRGCSTSTTWSTTGSRSSTPPSTRAGCARALGPRRRTSATARCAKAGAATTTPAPTSATGATCPAPTASRS